MAGISRWRPDQPAPYSESDDQGCEGRGQGEPEARVPRPRQVVRRHRRGSRRRAAARRTDRVAWPRPCAEQPLEPRHGSDLLQSRRQMRAERLPDRGHVECVEQVAVDRAVQAMAGRDFLGRRRPDDDVSTQLDAAEREIADLDLGDAACVRQHDLEFARSVDPPEPRLTSARRATRCRRRRAPNCG